MNVFSGIRSVFDAADALLRRVFASQASPDGTPLATLSRGLVDRSGAVVVAADLMPIPFVRTGTLTSAAAATAVSLIADNEVPPGRKVLVTGFVAKVNGATPWATTATVKVADSAGTAFSTIAVAALTGNAEVNAASADVTSGAAFNLGTGGGVKRGLSIMGNANGTGSNLVVTVTGFLV